MGSRKSKSQTDSEPKPLFALPNGSHLCFKRPSDCGNVWRWYDKPGARKWGRRAKRSNLLLFGLSSGTTQSVIFADFDELPQGFSGFDSLFAFLKNNNINRGIALRSVSGKCKLAVVVELPLGVNLDRRIALDNLKFILGDELFDYIDKRKSAVFQTYLSPDITKLLSAELPKVTPISCILDSAWDQLDRLRLFAAPASPPLVCQFPVSSQGADLTCRQVSSYRTTEMPLDTRLRGQVSINAELVLRFCLATPQLIEGFDISQEVLGNTLSVAQRTVGRYLRQLVVVGLLAVTDPKYVPGKKAITYRASGALLDVLHELYGAGRKQITELLPRHIPDGKWNETLLTVACKYFRANPERFMNWALSLPGIDKKDRLAQAKRLATWLSKHPKIESN